MTHLTFKDIESTGRKTTVFEVFGYKEAFLGTVSWSGGWRQYVFSPSQEPRQWSRDCLRELADFIEGLMTERKRGGENL